MYLEISDSKSGQTSHSFMKLLRSLWSLMKPVDNTLQTPFVLTTKLFKGFCHFFVRMLFCYLGIVFHYTVQSISMFILRFQPLGKVLRLKRAPINLFSTFLQLGFINGSSFVWQCQDMKHWFRLQTRMIVSCFLDSSTMGSLFRLWFCARYSSFYLSAPRCVPR